MGSESRLCIFIAIPTRFITLILASSEGLTGFPADVRLRRLVLRDEESQRVPKKAGCVQLLAWEILGKAADSD